MTFDRGGDISCAFHFDTNKVFLMHNQSCYNSRFVLFVIFIYTESAYFAPTARLQITSIGLIPRTFEHPVYSSYPYYPTFVAQYFVANSKATSTKSLFTRSLVRVQLLFSKIRCRKLLLRCPFLFLQSHSVTTVHRRSIVKKFIVARSRAVQEK